MFYGGPENSTPMWLPLIDFNNYLHYVVAINATVFNKLIREVEENQRMAIYNSFNNFGYVFVTTMQKQLMHYWNFYDSEKYNEIYNYVLSKINERSKNETNTSLRGVECHRYGVRRKFVIDLLIKLKWSLPIPASSDILFQETESFFISSVFNISDPCYLKALEGTVLTYGKYIKTSKWKVYRGVYSIYYRDFPTACKLFLECISTFFASELMTYHTFIRYTVYLSVMCLSRISLLKEIIENNNVKALLIYDGETRALLHSFYNCEYANFFLSLGKVAQRLKVDFLFHHHYQYYVYEMKVKAYNQAMKSYRSLALSHLAESFGVSEDYIEEDLATFIKSGRLSFRINRQTMTVESQRQDEVSAKFQKVIKEGDLLLTKIQRLSRIIHI